MTDRDKELAETLEQCERCLIAGAGDPCCGAFPRVTRELIAARELVEAAKVVLETVEDDLVNTLPHLRDNPWADSHIGVAITKCRSGLAVLADYDVRGERDESWAGRNGAQ